MWPPIPSCWCLLARVTITAAFQRTSLRMRLSSCSSPGNRGFLFGRDRIDIGGLDQLRECRCRSIRERLRIFRRTNCARSLPSIFYQLVEASQSIPGFRPDRGRRLLLGLRSHLVFTSL